MKQLTIFIILSLSLIYHSFGQKVSRSIKTEKKDVLVKTDSVSIEWNFNCRVVETEAKFENGPEDWETFLRENLKKEVPGNFGCPSGRYTVRINFAVSRDGKVTMAKATTNYGYGMEEEAMRIISLSPKWTPATRNGRIVNAYRFQLITFDVCESANVYLITSNCKYPITKVL